MTCKVPMSGIAPPGACHDEFTAWAKEQGIQVNGVGPAIIPGYGLGIVAQRRIEVTKPYLGSRVNGLNVVVGW